MILNRIDDPRSRLGKATRWELYQHAQAHGVKEIVHDMPASLMREILQNKGLTNIQIPPRTLGAIARRPGEVRREPQAGDKIVSVNATADLARQWAQQQAAPPPAPEPKPNGRPPRLVPRPRSEINRLRDECKALGIKMGRRDRMPDLKAKIEAHKAQHGQNAAQ